MSVGQFFLGIVTILVATVVYRWQKMVEREAELQHQQRELFSKYLSLTLKHFLAQPYRDQNYSEEELSRFFSISEEEIEIYTTRNEISLISSRRIHDAVGLHDRAFRAWKMSFARGDETDEDAIGKAKLAADEFRRSHNELLKIMRDELGEQQQFKLFLHFRRLLARSVRGKN